jgi:hypothetical protein
MAADAGGTGGVAAGHVLNRILIDIMIVLLLLPAAGMSASMGISMRCPARAARWDFAPARSHGCVIGVVIGRASIRTMRRRRISIANHARLGARRRDLGEL